LQSAALNDKAIINDSTFVNLKDYTDDFVYDMKYAEDNFLKTKVYDCAECYFMSEDGKSSSWKKPKNLSKEDIELTF
jgi:hypothetical protein